MEKKEYKRTRKVVWMKWRSKGRYIQIHQNIIIVYLPIYRLNKQSAAGIQWNFVSGFSWITDHHIPFAYLNLTLDSINSWWSIPFASSPLLSTNKSTYYAYSHIIFTYFVYALWLLSLQCWVILYFHFEFSGRIVFSNHI